MMDLCMLCLLIIALPAWVARGWTCTRETQGTIDTAVPMGLPFIFNLNSTAKVNISWRIFEFILADANTIRGHAVLIYYLMRAYGR